MITQFDLQDFRPILQSPIFAFASVIVLLISAIALYLPRTYEKTSIPVYTWDTNVSGDRRKRWMWDSLNLLREGYNRFHNEPFQIWTTEGYQVALPPKYFDEVKMLPDHTFPSSLRDFMVPEYTMTPSPPWKLDYVNYVIKHDINKNMSQIFPGLKEELEIALPLEFPPCEDWTQIPVYSTILRVICRLHGRAFVGEGTDLHRNAEWIQMSANFTKDIFRAGAYLRFTPRLLRPVVYSFIPAVRRVWKHNDRAQALLTPIIKQRERDEKSENYDRPNDAIEWMRDILPEPDKENYRWQGLAQLAIGAVSIHTTTQLITNSLFNLAAHPEYIPILKEEVDTVLKESGGEWTLDIMSKLKKLDSFIKETLRYNTPTTITFQRKVLKPITLSDGTCLPTGTLVFSPSNAISYDESIYSDASKFDGLRFYKLRNATAGDENKYQLTSTGKTQMSFGGGRHACPGRWFASHEIKLVLGTLLRRYEFKYNEGQGRPKNILFQAQHVPDPSVKILFKTLKH